MKKYYFFIVFVSFVIFLSGCQKDRTATVIYTDIPSPLTQMTFRETLPPETYSEYMETYTSETETSSGKHYFTMFMGNGIYADTGVTVPPADFGGNINSLKQDTAVITTTVPSTEISDVSEEIITCVPTGSETDTSELSSETTETTVNHTLARPKADTGVSVRSTKISSDTSAQNTSAAETIESEISDKSETNE